MISVYVLLYAQMIGAWIPRCTVSGIIKQQQLLSQQRQQGNPIMESNRVRAGGNNRVHRFMGSYIPGSSSLTDDLAAVDANISSFANRKNFSDQEMAIVQELYQSIKDLLSSEQDANQWQSILLKALPTMSTSLLVKLRTAAVPLSSSSSLQLPHEEDEIAIFRVAMAIEQVLQARMILAKETLESLLDAGEIRKLDARIGNFARAGRLDAAFFNVLTINLQDAAKDSSSSTATSSSKDTEASIESNDTKATRLQILQHIYTRCQEEVEKSLSPGTALLNKLMRTPQASIRANLYRHYLTPQPTTITSPDGKTISLPNNNNNNATLVDLTDFVQAIDETVLQIRNIEHVGGTDRESAAMMVESCRQIAKEARKILGTCYGRDSGPVKLLQDALQPVFRPTSPDSPYIQGDIQ
jgi:hypothetical protein